MPHPDHESLDNDIQRIASNAQTDDEALRAWQRAFSERVALPCDGFVIGEPVSVVEFCYDGNPRRGLTARCRRADETTHVVAACDVVLPPGSAGADGLAAYRRWLGLEPFHRSPRRGSRHRQHKVTAGRPRPREPRRTRRAVGQGAAARCRLPGTDRVITLRAAASGTSCPARSPW